MEERGEIMELDLSRKNALVLASSKGIDKMCAKRLVKERAKKKFSSLDILVGNTGIMPYNTVRVPT